MNTIKKSDCDIEVEKVVLGDDLSWRHIRLERSHYPRASWTEGALPQAASFSGTH